MIDDDRARCYTRQDKYAKRGGVRGIRTAETGLLGVVAYEVRPYELVLDNVGSEVLYGRPSADQ